MDLKKYKEVVNVLNGIGTVKITGVIGKDVSGLEKANEIEYLITYENVKEIDVRINSVGGSMVEGFGIISALEDAKKKGVAINTINDGLTASMGALIFQMGDFRRMHDFSLQMLHNPHVNGDEKGADPKQANMLNKFRESAITLLLNRSGLDQDKVEDMLNIETWLGAEESKELGLNDSIISTNKTEKKEEALNLIEQGAEALEVLNLYQGKKVKIENKMKDVLNHLKLEESATQEEALESIKAIESRVEELENTNVTLKTEKEEVEAKLEESTKEVENLTNQVAELSKPIEEKEKEELIANAIESKKIGEDAKEPLLLLDLEQVKNVLNSIETTKVNLLEQVKSEANKVETGNEELPSFRAMEKEDSKKLEAILNETPDKWYAMYEKEYGAKHPNDTRA